MNTGNPLLANLDSLHTTELGALRIKNNLSLTDEDVVEWCRSQISAPGTVITRNGKNGMLGKNSDHVADYRALLFGHALPSVIRTMPQ